MRKLMWAKDKATAEDGTVWATEPFPGYAGSPSAVTLKSTTVGGVSLYSHHLDRSSARTHATYLQQHGLI